MKMSTDKKLCPKIRALRTERLNEFRRRGYKFLADAIRASSGSSTALELLEAITEEGKEYQIEVTTFWDDKPDQDIRVTADVMPVPLQPLFGLFQFISARKVTTSLSVQMDHSLMNESQLYCEPIE